jgi:hypothetical protein
MDLNKLSKQSLTIQGVVLGLAMLIVGCSDSFSRRVANSADECVNMSSRPETTLFGFWGYERCLHLLQTATVTIKTNGIIGYAVLTPGNEEGGYRMFSLRYLSKDVDVREIIVMQDKKIVLSVPPPSREIAKYFKKQCVMFPEEIRWKKPDNPFQGYRAEDLTVKLVKDDGTIIGPVRMLSDSDVWEEIRAKMLTDKKWQDKFPWLYDRLQKDPSMVPLWRDPESLPPIEVISTND